MICNCSNEKQVLGLRLQASEENLIAERMKARQAVVELGNLLRTFFPVSQQKLPLRRLDDDEAATTGTISSPGDLGKGLRHKGSNLDLLLESFHNSLTRCEINLVKSRRGLQSALGTRLEPTASLEEEAQLLGDILAGMRDGQNKDGNFAEGAVLQTSIIFGAAHPETFSNQAPTRSLDVAKGSPANEHRPTSVLGNISVASPRSRLGDGDKNSQKALKDALRRLEESEKASNQAGDTVRKQEGQLRKLRDDMLSLEAMCTGWEENDRKSQANFHRITHLEQELKAFAAEKERIAAQALNLQAQVGSLLEEKALYEAQTKIWNTDNGRHQFHGRHALDSLRREDGFATNAKQEVLRKAARDLVATSDAAQRLLSSARSALEEFGRFHERRRNAEDKNKILFLNMSLDRSTDALKASRQENQRIRCALENSQLCARRALEESQVCTRQAEDISSARLQELESLECEADSLTRQLIVVTSELEKSCLQNRDFLQDRAMQHRASLSPPATQHRDRMNISHASTSPSHNRITYV